MVDYVTFVQIVQNNQLNLNCKTLSKVTQCSFLQAAAIFNFRIELFFLSLETSCQSPGWELSHPQRRGTEKSQNCKTRFNRNITCKTHIQQLIST